MVNRLLSWDEAIAGSPAPAEVLRQLELLNLDFWGQDAQLHQGQIMVQRELSGEIREIFRLLCEARFPIAAMVPLSHFNWSDDASMAANNTSGFNYRRVPRTGLWSHHARGRAVDINPLWNPWVCAGKADPPGATYDPQRPGTILRDGLVVNLFRERGWVWGGDWVALKDYHHFEKPC